MKNEVKEISVINVDGEALFSECDVIYEIPIYQRAFAWGTEMSRDINRVDEVCQLMDDICAFAEEKEGDETYHIGSLVVHKGASGSFEVVDGQQRLTALYVIAKCLNYKIAQGELAFGNGSIPVYPMLKYANRDYSQNAIDRLDDVISALMSGRVIGSNKAACETEDILVIEGREENGKVVDEKWSIGRDTHLESSICDAARRVLAKFESEGIGYQQKLINGLQHVSLFRIELPAKADLNQYFEIMNVRGRQLEQADIVKARLMGALDNDAKREWFARIWNACSDMSGYVQMHFSHGSDREGLFGKDWNVVPDIEMLDRLVREDIADDVSTEGGETILSAILDDKPVGLEFGEGGVSSEDDDNLRFRSVIYYPHFLLHVLRVFKNRSRGQLQTGPLNEKYLAKEFGTALESVSKESQADWAWRFAACLLRCRTIFDRYFIKRDFLEDAVDGEWSVRELKKSSETSWKYSETGGKGCDNDRCRMIESCLRVTYTEHKTMHWVTKLLDWLYGKCAGGAFPTMKETADECERIAGTAVESDMNRLKAEAYRMGTRTPHLLFNYLDYLLWRNDNNTAFAFEYRNSVEHWYPQHPTTIDEWVDGVEDANGIKRLDRDGFGNLCLIHDSENSRFSNLPPTAKAKYSNEMNECGSLKYRHMVKEIEEMSRALRGQDWKQRSFGHGKKMLMILADSIPGFRLELEQFGWPEPVTE